MFCQSGVISKVICDFCQSWVINNLFLITSLISQLFLISYPDSYLLHQTPELYRRYVLSKLGYQLSNFRYLPKLGNQQFCFTIVLTDSYLLCQSSELQRCYLFPKWVDQQSYVGFLPKLGNQQFCFTMILVFKATGFNKTEIFVPCAQQDRNFCSNFFFFQNFQSEPKVINDILIDYFINISSHPLSTIAPMPPTFYAFSS